VRRLYRNPREVSRPSTWAKERTEAVADSTSFAAALVGGSGSRCSLIAARARPACPRGLYGLRRSNLARPGTADWSR
jgi:hypothetical protein